MESGTKSHEIIRLGVVECPKGVWPGVCSPLSWHDESAEICYKIERILERSDAGRGNIRNS